MVSPLSRLAAEALAQVGEADGQRSFALWMDTAHGELARGDAYEAFSSEAAFAAAARAVLDVHLGANAATHKRAFPHIYEPPLFAWYRPSRELVEQLVDVVQTHSGSDPAELLGWLYQFSIPEHIRRQLGHFYTSGEIVASMLDGVGFTGSVCLAERLIDPACGAGAFLIEATRRVLHEADDAGLSPAESCTAVQQAVHGLDLNPLGVLLTEAALALLLAPRITALPDGIELQPLHLYVTDSLRAGELRAEAHANVAEDIKARTGEYESGFAYVVANPPYAKWPSRLMTPEQARRFSATTYGHPNLYGLFLQVGVELLAEGGRLAFINPKSFVSGLYFRNLRQFLKREVDLQRFDTFEKRTGLFDGVLQEVVILTAERRPERVEEIELREYAGTPVKPPARETRVPRASVLLGKDFDHAFFIEPNPLAHLVLAKMSRARPLSDLGVEAVTGTIVWNRLKPHVRDEPSEDALPLVWGNGVRTFRFAGLGNRAGQGTHMALVAKTLGIVSYGEALLVKRMTAREEPRRLVACRLPDEHAGSDRGYFAENHVNLVRPKPGGAKVELDAVLGLLNSRLFDFVFRALNGNTQVSATELELLPIADGPELDAIAEQARRLTASDGRDYKAQARLDELVFRLYDLEEDEVKLLAGERADELLAVG
jgi:adenine-specific DNA-methyltransferase